MDINYALEWYKAAFELEGGGKKKCLYNSIQNICLEKGEVVQR